MGMLKNRKKVMKKIFIKKYFKYEGKKIIGKRKIISRRVDYFAEFDKFFKEFFSLKIFDL